MISLDRLHFQTFAISSPIVAISHSSQEPAANATILWTNALSMYQPGYLPNRIPFVEETTWGEMKKALKMFFLSKSGCSLTEQNLSYLCKCFVSFTGGTRTHFCSFVHPN